MGNFAIFKICHHFTQHNCTCACTREFDTDRICEKKPSNAYTDVSIGGSTLNFGSSLHLHPSFMYANSEGSGESAHMRGLACVFIVRHRDTYRNLVLMIYIYSKRLALKSVYMEVVGVKFEI